MAGRLYEHGANPGETKAWFESVLRGYGPIRWMGEWEGKCKCPFHEDKEPSFSFNAKKGVWNCHAGCGGGGMKALAEKLGVTPPWGEKKERASMKGLGARETLYDYRDADDRLVYQVVRWDEPGKEKTVRQRRPDGKGGWEWNMKGVKPLLYRLPDVLETIREKKWVFIAEGEKCVDALVQHGLHATTNHGGAGKWWNGLNQYFPAGTHIAIVYDCDNAGLKHLDMVGRALSARGCDVRKVDLGYPYVEKHARDIYDWFAEGHTKDELIKLVRSAPVFSVAGTGEEGSGLDDVPLPDDEDATWRKRRVRHSSGDPVAYKIVGGYRMNDSGNAQRLIDTHGKDLRYCHKWKKWLTWDNRRWDENAPFVPTQFCISVTERMYEDAEEIEDWNERQDYLEFVNMTGNNARISAMLKIAQDYQGIPVDPSQLDTGGYYLNCTNGTVDLRTGHLAAHARSDLITKMLPFHYNPSATCPIWEKFLHRIMDGNQGLIDFLQRAVGYALTGSTREQCFFVLYGTGRNGKSTMLKTIKALMGDYARQAAAETFMIKKNAGGPGDDVAMLRGARFVTAIETEENQRLAESLVKQITGGDTLSVRRLYENFFEFEPEFKIFLATNHKPSIRGSDDGIWRRIRLIPFTVRITDDEVDLELANKLHDEMEGILTWAVNGCLEWQTGGLQEPEDVWGATEQYRQEMDTIGSFLDEVCVLDKNYFSPIADLHKAYQKWAEENGERDMSKNMLGRRLQDRGFKKDQANASNRARGHWGLRVAMPIEKESAPEWYR